MGKKEEKNDRTIFSRTANCFKANSEPSDFNCSKIVSTFLVLIENKRLMEGNSFSRLNGGWELTY